MVGAFSPKGLDALGAPVSEGEVVDAVLLDLLWRGQVGACHLGCRPDFFLRCSEFLGSWDRFAWRWGVLTLKNRLAVAALASAHTW